MGFYKMKCSLENDLSDGNVLVKRIFSKKNREMNLGDRLEDFCHICSNIHTPQTLMYRYFGFMILVLQIAKNKSEISCGDKFWMARWKNENLKVFSKTFQRNVYASLSSFLWKPNHTDSTKWNKNVYISVSSVPCKQDQTTTIFCPLPGADPRFFKKVSGCEKSIILRDSKRGHMKRQKYIHSVPCCTKSVSQKNRKAMVMEISLDHSMNRFFVFVVIIFLLYPF